MNMGISGKRSDLVKTTDQKTIMANQTKYKKVKAILKVQLTQLQNVLNRDHCEKSNIQLRLERLNEKYDQVERLYEETTSTENDDEQLHEFTELQDRFFELVSQAKDKIERLSPPLLENNNQSISVDSGTASKIKLPLANLPKFEGNYENWISFKNTFTAMIDTRGDLNDVEKLIYLRSSLIGNAAQKITIFENSAENYKLAWDLLRDSYEIKRLIVSKHLQAIYDITPLKFESHDGLIQLADTVQQHMTALETLGASVGSDMLVFLIERKLPEETVKKWEMTLTNDELPSFQQLRKFLMENAVRASKREQRELHTSSNSIGGDQPAAKKFKSEKRHNVLYTNTTNCIVCKDQHLLYQCPEFLKMTVPNRIDSVKRAKLCINCLRRHTGQCMRSKCKQCHKKHNTLLHLNKEELKSQGNSAVDKTNSL
ncbi:uncharacterized protein [Prorops nasuta]|uniref:uncharacterized protein n=1 Tax=Prorops nasuta TaxID=863751 RepID=UPI0034CD8823